MIRNYLDIVGQALRRQLPLLPSPEPLPGMGKTRLHPLLAATASSIPVLAKDSEVVTVTTSNGRSQTGDLALPAAGRCYHGP